MTHVNGQTMDYTATMQMLVGWREGAWRNAEALVNAPCYSYSMPVIIAITDPRGPPEDSNLEQFGRV